MGAAIREVLVCSREPTNVGKIFVVKLYSRKIFLYVFYVQKYFHNKNKANYGTSTCCQCIEGKQVCIDAVCLLGISEALVSIARNLNSVAVRTLISVAYGVISKTRKFTLYRICNYP